MNNNKRSVGLFASTNSTAKTPAYTQLRGDRSSSVTATADAMLEAAIAVAAVRLGHAQSPDEKDDAWRELTSLHAQRSAEQVRRMDARVLRR